MGLNDRRWAYCFCGKLATVEGVCQAHDDLYELVQAGLFSDWGVIGIMSHAEMQTEMGLAQIPRFRNRLAHDQVVAAQITAMRLATLGDWREHEGNGRAA